MRFFLRQCFVCVLISLLVFPPAAFGRSAVADKSASQNKRPTVDAAPNGVPLVHIAKPSKSGLSHNQYTQFSVGQKGLILNNSAQTGVSKLGGAVLANPNLAPRGEAKVILNEVTSSSRSHIEGYIEVHGKRADVILANPNGVTVNGGGFINTDRATITTGKPQFDAFGALTSFDVRAGDVRIDGAGMDAGNVTAFDIVSRAAAINAEIYADEIAITTGQNAYDPATRKATPLSPDKSTAPKVAIDSSALGGMYAGRITLTSTEKGVGVNLQGIAQSLGDIAISSEGQLVIGAKTGKQTTLVTNGHLKAQGKSLEIANTATGTKGSTTLTADSIAVQKSNVYAGQNIALQAKDKLSLAASELNAEQAFTGKGAAIDLQNLDLISGKDLSFSGQSLTAKKSSLQSGGKSTATMTGTVSFDDFALAAGSDIAIKGAAALVNNADITGLGHINLTSNIATIYDSGLIAAKGLSLSGTTLTGGRGSLLQSNEDMTLSASQALNFDTIQLQSGKNVSLASKGTLDLREARLSAQGAGSIAGTAVTASNVKVVADKGLSLDGQSLQANDTSFHTAGALQVKTTDDVALHNTELASNAELSLQGTSLLLENTALDATKSLTLQGTGVTLRNLSFATDGLLKLTAHSLFADNADVYAGNNALLTISNTVELLNTEIFSRQDISLQGAVTALQKTKLGAGKNIALTATGLSLKDTTAIADASLTLTAKSLSGRGNALHSGRITTLAMTENLALTDIEIMTDGALSLAGKNISLTEAALGAKTSLTMLTPGTLTLTKADVLSGGLFTLNGNTLSFTEANLEAKDTLSAHASGNITLQNGQMATSGNLTIEGKDIQFADATLGAEGNLTAIATHLVLTDTAAIAHKMLTLTAQSLTGNNITVQAGGNAFFAITGNAHLTAAEVLAGDDLTLKTKAFSLANSRFGAEGLLKLKSTDVTLDGAQLIASKDLSLDVKSFDATGSKLHAGGSATLLSQEAVTLKDSEMITSQDLALQSSALRLQDGKLGAEGTLGITAASAFFTGTSLITNKALTLAVQSFTGLTNKFHVGTNLGIESQNDVALKDSEVLVGGNISVKGKALDLTGTTLGAEGNIIASGTTASLSGATLIANKLLALTVSSLTGTRVKIQSGTGMAITSQNGAITLAAGEIRTGGKLSLSSKALTLADTDVAAQGTITVTATDTVLTAVTLITNEILALTLKSLTAKNAILSANTKTTVTSTGNIGLTETEIASGGILAMQGGNVTLADSQLTAANDLTLTGKATRMDDSVLVTNEKLALTIQSLTGDGATLQSRKDATLESTGKVQVTDFRLTGGGLVKLLGNTITLAKASLSALGSMTITSKTLADFSDLSLVTNAALAIVAQTVTGKKTTLHAGGTAHIKATGNLTFTDTSEIASGAAVTVAGNGVKLQDTSITAANALAVTGTKSIYLDNFAATAGKLLSFVTEKLHVQSALLQSKESASLQSTGTLAAILDNLKAVASNDITLIAKGLNAKDGTLHAGRTALLNVSEGATSLQNITAVAGKNLSLTTQALTAKKATLHAGEAASVSVTTDTVASFDDVKMLAGKALSLLSYGVLAKNSALQAGETATVTMKGGRSLDLQNVTAVAGKNLRITAQELKATDSLLHAGELASVVLTASVSFVTSQLAAGSDLTLKGKTLTLQGSKLSAQHAAQITGTAVQMNDTTLVAGKDVSLAAQSLVGKDVTLHAGGSLGIDITGALQLDDADVIVDNALTAQANSLHMLRSTVQAGKNITLTSDTQALFDATKAVSGNALTVTAQTIEGKGSKLYANTLATLSTPETVTLTNSEVVANTDVSIQAKDLKSTQTKLLAGNAMRFTLNTAFVNTTGTILQTIGSLFISAPEITNAGGTIFAEGDLTLQSKRDIINEENGLIFAGNNLSLLAKRYILNKENAVLMADGDLLIEGLSGARAAKLHNYAGLVESLSGNLTIRADVVENMATESVIELVAVMRDYFQHNIKGGFNPYMEDGSPNYATWAHWNRKTGSQHIPREYRKEVNLKYGIGLDENGETKGDYDKPYDGRVYQEWLYEDEQRIAKRGVQGKILAAGNITIDADSILNRESTLSAGNNISIIAKTLDNIGTELSRFTTIYRQYRIVSESKDRRKENPHRVNYEFMEVIDAIPAIINAGGRLAIVAENAVNNTGLKENAN